ncbi:MAG: hypothetical protein HY744_30590 [Deltaproteobacteria bacterium]|nr:hypothetical protein [Deltaproteobacteria bacterium]
MTRLDVARLRLTLGDRWTVAVKWDDCPAYREGIGKLQGELEGRSVSTRAVDIVAFAGKELVLLEAKDFRPVRRRGAPPVPNAVAYGGRWKELPLEVALKARDTVAGLWGLAATGSSDGLVRSAAAARAAGRLRRPA